MLETRNSILIFTSDYLIGGLVVIQNNEIKYALKDDSIKSELQSVLEEIKKKNPALKIGFETDDGKLAVAFSEVETKDKKYPTAVAEEINRRGLTAALVSPIHIKL